MSKMGIGDILYDLFAELGDQGILICIFLLFFLDALLVPTLPELFFILAIGAKGTWDFSACVLAAGFLGEMVGVFLLYSFLCKVRVPARIERVMTKYIDFLFVSDEKVMLINRIAPMVPFVGAFMALMRKRWDVRKCIFWLVVGYVAKYGLIMIMGQSLTDFFGSGTSRTVMIVAIIAIIIFSAGLAAYRKRKLGIEKKESQ